ncbi:hypothetical protein [Caulobacter sp. DWR2-3-1b2]|uniref:hypothetical protein n=1 Tax=unclassified Caulobacter TaxID=2648921 RepID=UPI003CFA7D64
MNVIRTIGEALTLGARAIVMVCAAGLLASCDEVAMSDADRAFDAAFTTALARHQPIDLARLETGDWFQVCAIGEDRPASMLPGQRPRPGEAAFDTLIDPAFLPAGQADGGALAYTHPDGVEVRPLSGLAINMGASINRCVPRKAAVLVDSPDTGWRFRDYPTSTDWTAGTSPSSAPESTRPPWPPAPPAAASR